VDPRDPTIGLTPLHLAAESGHKRVCEILIDKGADVEEKNVVSSYRYDMADIFTCPIVIRQDVSCCWSDDGYYLLISIDVLYPYQNKIVMQLENTPLHLAAENGYQEVCKVLIPRAKGMGSKTRKIAKIWKNNVS
jgi:ankyrin repeat protein